MKRIVGCCIVLFLFLSLTCVGCQKETEVEDQNSVEINGKVEKKDEEEENWKTDFDYYETTLPSGIKVEAEVNIPNLLNGNAASVYQAEPLIMDVKKVSDLLMSTTEVSYQEQEQRQENGDSGILRYYTGADGSELVSANDTWIQYSSSKFKNIRTDFELDVDEKINTKIDFAFATQSEADQDIKRILENIGISVYSKYECIPMEYEMLKTKNLEQFDGLEDIEEFQKDISILNNIPWSQDYDCYCFVYYGTIDNWKLESTDREVSNAIIPGSIIRVAYTENGIQKIEFSNIYGKQRELETGKIITIEQMLEIVNKKYDSIIMQGNYTITSIELEYVADVKNSIGTYVLVPVWKCHILHEFNTQNKTTDDIVEAENESCILIDAIKGIEVYSGGVI